VLYLSSGRSDAAVRGRFSHRFTIMDTFFAPPAARP